MSDRDQPWNDFPVDDDLPGGVPEPDPAEVEGDEDDEAMRDTSLPVTPDPVQKYVQETLDQRLAAELPDRAERARAGPSGELVAPDRGGGDISLAEPDASDGTAPSEEPGAEDAAIHVVDEERVLGGD